VCVCASNIHTYKFSHQIIVNFQKQQPAAAQRYTVIDTELFFVEPENFSFLALLEK